MVIVAGEARATLETRYEIEWIRQFGTSAWEMASSVSADGLGKTYILGRTQVPENRPKPGSDHVFLWKCDSAGSLSWRREFGSRNYRDAATEVSADSLGNVFISGMTDGYKPFMIPTIIYADPFLGKYDSVGNLLWSHKLGATKEDRTSGVAADGLSNVYVSGYTKGSLGGPNAGDYDGFLSKYDSAGVLMWSRQLGTPSPDTSSDVSVDGLGNVYVSGHTAGSLVGPNAGERDAFVIKYDSEGSLLWSRQFGTTEGDITTGVSADGVGNVYISGLTKGSLGGPNTGDYDAFVTKFDPTGALLWTRQFGTSDRDSTSAVAADHLGNIFISGYTDGSLGAPNAGDCDVFVTHYDSTGSLLGTHQIGTGEYDVASGVSVDGLGAVYISGYTGGSLGGPIVGAYDAFVVKLTPEPGTIFLLGLGGLGVLRKRKA